MKALMVGGALAGIATTTSVFHQTPVSTAPNYGAQQSAMTQVEYVGTAAQAGQWVPPYVKTARQETHAHVYHDLAHAERGSHSAYLNSTVVARN